MKISLFFYCAALLSMAAADEHWHALPEALRQAAQEQQPVLVYVHAPWCGPCEMMETSIFPQAAPLLDRFIKARLQFDDHESSIPVGNRYLTPYEWSRHLGINATPGFVFLDHNGNLLTHYTGYLDARSFNLLLAFVVTGAHKHASFDAYIKSHG